jgi:hypothetical protein
MKTGAFTLYLSVAKLCLLPCALCTLPCALCSLPFALCPLPFATSGTLPVHIPAQPAS